MHDVDRLIRYCKDKRTKAGDAEGAEWFNGLLALYGGLHELLKRVVSPPSRATRLSKILEQIELSVRMANAADLDPGFARWSPISRGNLLKWSSRDGMLQRGKVGIFVALPLTRPLAS